MRNLSQILILLLMPLVAAGPALAQVPRTPATQPAASRDDELVMLDFPADGVEISVLADIVTQQLRIPIVYDEQIKNKKVVIRVPVKVPVSALMGVLQSALRLKQLALVDAEQPGWKQIVPAPNLAAVARPPGAARGGVAPAGGEGAVAEVFVLVHADPARVAEIIRPFLTQPNGYMQADPARRILIVGDYASVVSRIAGLIQVMDSEGPKVETRFVPLRDAEATWLAPAITQLLASRQASQTAGAGGSGVFITADDRVNQVVVIAPPDRIQEVLELIAGMDKSPDLRMRVYRLKSVTPERADRLIRGLLGPGTAKRAYQAAVDHESVSLAVSATPEVHARIEALLKELDAPVKESQSPIHFYKLKNTKAADVLATLGGLLGQDQPRQHDPASAGDAGPENGMAAAGRNPSQPGVPSATMAMVGSPAHSPSGNNLISSTGLGAAQPATTAFGAQSDPAAAAGGNGAQAYASPTLASRRPDDTGDNATSMAIRGRDATVAADANSNSIIVVAPPQVQQIYADLIKRLDERRPQVQIECTIVTLDTSGGFTFGVDIGKLGAFGASQLLTLSSFGVSVADPSTAKLKPAASTGGTFALLSPRIADVVITALQTNSHSRFLSAPQLLVNDNGKGKLESVAQEPYAVILDASSTQSLTSLGGQAQAGTSITVEPHISEADYLQLAYSIELSNFTGAASNGLPPPSEKNSVDSSVTIPDGYTIVVGGLTTKTFNTSVNTIPILGDIPILKDLFGTRSRNANDTTLFVFIKPTILRDDRFEDLKYISARSARQAGLPDDYPQGEPIPMK
jgi:general secretion pathway protein D